MYRASILFVVTIQYTYRYCQVTPLDTTLETKEIQVEAPEELPEGYKLEAEWEGNTYIAVVPVGGVKQGELLTAQLKSPGIDAPASPTLAQAQNVPEPLLVEFEAPCDLPGGCEVEVEIDGEPRLAIVPPVGAKEGEIVTATVAPQATSVSLPPQTKPIYPAVEEQQQNSSLAQAKVGDDASHCRKYGIYYGISVVSILIVIIIAATGSRSIDTSDDGGCDSLCYEDQDCCVPSTYFCGNEACYCNPGTSNSFCRDKEPELSGGATFAIIAFVIITVVALSCACCKAQKRCCYK